MDLLLVVLLIASGVYLYNRRKYIELWFITFDWYYDVWIHFASDESSKKHDRKETLKTADELIRLKKFDKVEYLDAIRAAFNLEKFVNVASRLFEIEVSIPPRPPKEDSGFQMLDYQIRANEYKALMAQPNFQENFTSRVIKLLEQYHPLAGDGQFKTTEPVTSGDVENIIRYLHDHHQFFPKTYKAVDANFAKMGAWPEADFPHPVEYWLKDTALEDIKLKRGSIKLENRFEHCHILGGSGQGKTQLLQYLISQDLNDDCTVVVIDNQRQMIDKLARLGHDMALISPRYDLAINLFDRPRADTTTGLLKYVLSALMDSALTAKQELIFEFAIQLMLVTPKATILTLRHLLESKPHLPDHLDKLDPISQDFFTNQFWDRSYDSTKQEISWRIWSLLKNPKLARMFSATENRVDISRELHRKLILIDTDVDTLQQYSGFFGRFLIAQLLEAAQERFKGQHRPVYIYIDEMYSYMDASIASMLETARKAKFGLHLAHQYLGQITEPKLQAALMSLTSTKFAAGLSVSDTHSMAMAMHTTTEFIKNQKKLQFALYMKNGGTHSVTVPAGVVEDMAHGSIPDEEMKARYTVPRPPMVQQYPPPEPEFITPAPPLPPTLPITQMSTSSRITILPPPPDDLRPPKK